MGNTFTFHDLPEIILKKQMSRKDYIEIMKVIQKVKSMYLVDKAKKNPDKPHEHIVNIVEGELVELDLFEQVLS